MICLLCGNHIGKAFPVPISRLEFTPIIPVVQGITANRLGMTILTDRLCCQDCYKRIKDNDQKIIEEAGKIPASKK